MFKIYCLQKMGKKQENVPRYCNSRLAFAMIGAKTARVISWKVNNGVGSTNKLTMISRWCFFWRNRKRYHSLAKIQNEKKTADWRWHDVQATDSYETSGPSRRDHARTRNQLMLCWSSKLPSPTANLEENDWKSKLLGTTSWTNSWTRHATPILYLHRLKFIWHDWRPVLLNILFYRWNKRWAFLWLVHKIELTKLSIQSREMMWVVPYLLVIWRTFVVRCIRKYLN